MEIDLQDVGKRFQFDWIFRHLTHTFKTGQPCAILGSNGSGKSTLMKVLSGHLSPTKGNVLFSASGQIIDRDSYHRHVSYAAPYIELIEEFTLMEHLHFHQRFQSWREGLAISDVLEVLELGKKAKHRPIRFFSSGMKQRLKLALACCSNTGVLLLDEPTTNLDEQGMQWYLGLVRRFATDRLVIVASNVGIDYDFCVQQIDIRNYKT